MELLIIIITKSHKGGQGLDTWSKCACFSVCVCVPVCVYCMYAMHN